MKTVNVKKTDYVIILYYINAFCILSLMNHDGK